MSDEGTLWSECEYPGCFGFFYEEKSIKKYTECEFCPVVEKCKTVSEVFLKPEARESDPIRHDTKPYTRDRAGCLNAAMDAVVGGREVAYGAPENNFVRIARLWQAFLHNKTGVKVEIFDTDVALMLDLMKTARLQHNPYHFDSWADKAGYSACGCELGRAE